MCYRSIAIVLFFLLRPLPAAAATTRPVDQWADAVLALALQRSAVVRAMVNDLDDSKVIVHIESSRLLPIGVGGITRFVTSQGGYRYVRITLSVWLPPSDRVAILGHELQHALELARSGVTDREGVRRLLQAEGYTVRGEDFYETRAALLVEREIRGELRRREALPDKHRIPTSIASRQVVLPDKRHFPTSSASRQAALPDK